MNCLRAWPVSLATFAVAMLCAHAVYAQDIRFESDRASEREELETDRDAFTPAMTTVGSRTLVVESAYSFVDGGSAGDTHSFPELLTRYGVSDWLELRLGWNYEIGGESSVSSSGGGGGNPAGAAPPPVDDTLEVVEAPSSVGEMSVSASAAFVKPSPARELSSINRLLGEEHSSLRSARAALKAQSRPAKARPPGWATPSGVTVKRPAAAQGGPTPAPPAPAPVIPLPKPPGKPGSSIFRTRQLPGGITQDDVERGLMELGQEGLAQKMDALSSQANLAGYVAVILAAEHLDKVFPMMMTPAGTLDSSTPMRLPGTPARRLSVVSTSWRRR